MVKLPAPSLGLEKPLGVALSVQHKLPAPFVLFANVAQQEAGG